MPQRCPECLALDLKPLGEGTERIEEFLRKRFSDFPVVRVDRDTTRGKNALEDMMNQVRKGQPCILVGTQMLAKGHHFPGLQLAVVVNVDQSLYSVDFRSMERLAQLLTQVAGRTGRGERPGLVVLQTHHPDHPMLIRLMNEGYATLAQSLLEERQAAGLPPAVYQAIVRVEAKHEHQLSAFIEEAKEMMASLSSGEVRTYGPVPALQAKKAGLSRMQLTLECKSRPRLHRFLKPWMAELEKLPQGKRVRWVMDVDPQEF